MCGILGEFGRTVSHKKEFEKILSLSKNRGPDMVGYNSNGKSYQFGFNRLAILDITEKRESANDFYIWKIYTDV